MATELKELRVTRHHAGEPKRRWFSADGLDLIVWMNWSGWGPPVGFQLCYDKLRHEKAFTWTRAGGFMHQRVDDGEHDVRRYKQAPVLVAEGDVNIERLTLQFERAASGLPPKIAALVFAKLRECKEADHANRQTTSAADH